MGKLTSTFTNQQENRELSASIEVVMVNYINYISVLSRELRASHRHEADTLPLNYVSNEIH